MQKIRLQPKKGNNPLLDKIIAQGGGPVLRVCFQRYCYCAYFKRADIKILLQINVIKFVLGKTNNCQRCKKDKDVDAVELF
jgi:SecD/SecF fusion protein